MTSDSAGAPEHHEQRLSWREGLFLVGPGVPAGMEDGQEIYAVQIPEPGVASLSLLALAIVTAAFRADRRGGGVTRSPPVQV